MKIIVSGEAFLEPQTDFDLKNYEISPKTYLDRASSLALAGCALALQNAGLRGPFDEDFGIALGTQFGAVETMRTFEGTLAEKGSKGVSPLIFSHSYFNSPVSLCAIEWGLRGWHGTFCGEDALQKAVEAARDAIILGHATRMLCGGVEAISVAQSWSETENPREWSRFYVLERAEGRTGRDVEDLARELRF
ncbi:MAG TPA: beta-ketoacyl synthase N-terminal-like domain-containing protein [Abditibacterium sp.]|jgi:3-oxoacyl-(acyl-carrier-protein) synthase